MNSTLTRMGMLAALGLTALTGHGQTVDGTRDSSYPTALAVQTLTTSFGNANVGTVGVANGSELDNIHAKIVGTDLYVFIGGNLQTNIGLTHSWNPVPTAKRCHVGSK